MAKTGANKDWSLEDNSLSYWVVQTGSKVCIVFEGRDGAGKGGAIKAITERVRIFDRSWYNRAGVERVMGFCSEEDVVKFLAAVPLVEDAIVGSGVLLLKYWLEVSEEEQNIAEKF
jgi:polyphosphate kinase 2 (PPK2 family)